MLCIKWTLLVVTLVLCQVFAPLCSCFCFSGKGKLGLFWPIRSHMLLIICGGVQVLARTAPSLWVSSASGSRCFGFYLLYYSAWSLLMSCLPCGSVGSLPANWSLHYSLLLQLCYLKMLSVVLHFWITDYRVKLCRFKASSMMISIACSVWWWLRRISHLGQGSHVFNFSYIDFYIVYMIHTAQLQ